MVMCFLKHIANLNHVSKKILAKYVINALHPWSSPMKYGWEYIGNNLPKLSKIQTHHANICKSLKSYSPCDYIW